MNSIHRIAGRALTGMLFLLLLFHLVMLSGALPSNIVWGGRAGEAGEVPLALQFVSVLVTLLFIFIAAVRSRILKMSAAPGIFRAGNWVMVVYFLLNVAGNLASRSSLERAIFVPYSALLAILSLVSALGGKRNA